MPQKRVKSEQGAWPRKAMPLLGLSLILVGGPWICTMALRDVFVMPKQLAVAAGVLLLWGELLRRAWSDR